MIRRDSSTFFGSFLVLCALGFGLLSILGCCGAQRPVADPRGTLRFTGEPQDALLEVDENHLGPLRMFEKTGLLLRPGAHRVIARAEGYFPDYQIVEIEKDKVVVLKIHLRPQPQ